jgi:hypothetical protein
MELNLVFQWGLKVLEFEILCEASNHGFKNLKNRVPTSTWRTCQQEIFDIKSTTKCSIKKEESTNTYLNLQTLGKFLLQF